MTPLHDKPKEEEGCIDKEDARSNKDGLNSEY